MSRRTKIDSPAMVLNPMTKLQWLRENWSPADFAAAKNAIRGPMLEYRKEDRSRESGQTPIPIRATAGRRTVMAPSASQSARALTSGLAQVRALAKSLSNLDIPAETPAAVPKGQTEEEKAEAEHRAVAEDERLVDEELARYEAKGLLTESHSELADFELLRFWESPFLDLLFKYQCIRTQKKQKGFYWPAGWIECCPSHDRLFLDALERVLKREKMGLEPTTQGRFFPSAPPTARPRCNAPASARDAGAQYVAPPGYQSDMYLTESPAPFTSSPGIYSSGLPSSGQQYDSYRGVHHQQHAQAVPAQFDKGLYYVMDSQAPGGENYNYSHLSPAALPIPNLLTTKKILT
ncbi:hypothetical protein DFH07DRAFT_977093 [Mycena maculata]|uniref:Uncharacterized protein n=1 Tax=Mycena maculata TaxID=230809 RepID=A0AAD7ILL6_9AGAR|nr:hypothetical protein DFH07DRAFT_977093 [Mycena maculata]